MTTTRHIILGELPPAKATTPEQRARAKSTRHYAEWETPEGVCDVPDPLWSATGFGPTGHDAYVDLIANTAHDRRGQTDEELYSLLAGHVLVLKEAAERADHYAASAFNSATSKDGADAEALIKLGQTWTQTAATLRRMAEPASDTPLTDCPPHLDDQLTDEVTFTAPDGRVFSGSPADVGVGVAETLLKHDGDTWWLPSVIRDHAAEHIGRVLDVLRWDPADRPKAAQAALHLYCLISAESDEDRAQRIAALDATLAADADKAIRQPGESDAQLRERVKAAAPKLRDAIIEALADLDAFDDSDGQDHLAPGRAANTLRRALNPDPTQENPDAAR